MIGATLSRSFLPIGVLIAAVAALGMSLLAVSPASGSEGGPPECADPSTVVQADDQGAASGFAIGIAGEIVSVCVATEDDHTALVTEDGTFLDGCVDVSGTGTNIVTITRAPDCAAVTHIDVFVLPVPDDEVTEPQNGGGTDDATDTDDGGGTDDGTDTDDNGDEDGVPVENGDVPVENGVEAEVA